MRQSMRRVERQGRDRRFSTGCAVPPPEAPPPSPEGCLFSRLMLFAFKNIRFFLALLWAEVSGALRQPLRDGQRYVFVF